MSVHADAALMALDAFASGEVDVLDQLHAADYVDHTPLPGLSAGRSGLRERAMVLSSAFYDTCVSAVVLVDQGDTVVLQARARGVHKGDFLGQAATGRQVEAVGLCVFRFVDGLISQAWSSFEYSSPQPAARESYLPRVRGPVQYLAAMA
ncbi:MAG: hypothetical protein QOE40_346 [Actinomycetota bacterium]|nr:hypothetical protein [Actinomycetota bacterium]